MDESEKRRERLKAIRMEASESGDHGELGKSSDVHQLSNPLIENSPVPQMDSNAAARFDYYTDPLAAFTSNKRGKVGNQNSQAHATPTRPWNSEMRPFQSPQVQSQLPADQRMPQAQGPYHGSGSNNPGISTPSPAHHFQPNFSPNQSVYQARGPYHGPGLRNPEMTPPSPANQIRPNHSPHQQMYQPRSPYQSSDPPHYSPHQQMYQPRSPYQNVGYSPLQQSYQARSPHQSSGPYGSPLGMTGCGNFPSPGFGGSPNFGSGQGRGRWSSNSPGSGPGRGGAPSHNNTGRGRGRSSRLGRGGNGGSGRSNVSAELRPDLYYTKSMVDDPWKHLSPVIWKKRVTVFSKFSNSPNTAPSLPKNTGIKKARFEGDSNESSSQPSLAEYLAAAFNEVVEEEPGDDKPS